MSDISDLDERVGRIAETIGQSDGERANILSELQKRLGVIQGAVASKNAKLDEKDDEIRRLTEENGQLRELVQRLTALLETAKNDSLSEHLRSLDTAIDALAVLTEAAQAEAVEAEAEEPAPQPEESEATESDAPAPAASAGKAPEPAQVKPAAASVPKKDFPFGIDDRKWIRDVIDGASKATMSVGASVKAKAANAKAKADTKRNEAAYGPEPTPVSQNRLALIHGGDLAAEPAG